MTVNELVDKLVEIEHSLQTSGTPRLLNESVLNESSSLALSVYSPENLASLLEDKVEMTREEKIAMFRNQQVSVN